MGARADGLRKSEAFEETEELLGLAGRIADREPVDWAAELGRPERAAERPFLRALEAIDRLGAISGGIELELPPPKASAPRERWGDLELLGLLGKGSYGAVHVARDPQLDRLIALKIFRGAAGSERARRDALREGRLLARLKHPNVATVYGFDEREGELGLRMELVRGQTLAQRVAEQGPMGAFEAALAGVEICRALAAAHAAGILHRDVKAQNVVREEGGRLVLVDFGLGLENAAAEGARPSGTPLYLAPEIVAGRAASERSDLYALGVTLYHLVTGGYPVEAESREELVDRLARGVRRPLRDRRPDLPQGFVVLVDRALESDPAVRFASAGEMERALLGFVSASGAPGRRRRRSGLLVAGVALTFALAATVVMRIRMDSDSPASPSQVAPRRLTSGPLWETEPAISPDGTLLAYVSNEGGNLDIWLLDTRGGEPLQLTEDPASDRWPSWLADGSGIVFQSDRDGTPAIWKVGRLGGPASFVAANALQPAVSPDGKRIAFAGLAAGAPSRIAVQDLVDAGEPRFLTTGGTGVWGHESPAWSPDGRWIAFVDLANLWVVASEGGAPRALTNDNGGASSPSWSHDGAWVYFRSLRERTTALWRVPAAGGAAERVTLGSAAESHPRISRDGSRLVYATSEDRIEVVVSEARTGRLLERMRGSGWRVFPTFSPDDSRLLYVTTDRGSADLWISSLEAGRPAASRPLVVSNGQVSHPSFSPDGRFVVYQRRTDGDRDLHVVPTSGGTDRPLVATSEPELMPAWSPRGDLISFVRQSGGRFLLLVQPVRDGRTDGAPRAIEGLPGSPLTQAWSPDGRRLAVVSVAADSTADVWLVDLDTGAWRRTTRGAGARRAMWIDAVGLAVSGSFGARGVRLQRVDVETGEVSPLAPGLDFGSGSQAGSWGFDFTSDRSVVAFAQSDTVGDLWLLEGGPARF